MRKRLDTIDMSIALWREPLKKKNEKSRNKKLLLRIERGIFRRNQEERMLGVLNTHGADHRQRQA